MVSDEGLVEGSGEGLERGSEEGCEEGLQADLGLRGTDGKALLRAACLTLSCTSAASAAASEVWAKVSLRSVDKPNGVSLDANSFSTGESVVVRKQGEGALLPFISRLKGTAGGGACEADGQPVPSDPLLSFAVLRLVIGCWLLWFACDVANPASASPVRFALGGLDSSLSLSTMTTGLSADPCGKPTAAPGPFELTPGGFLVLGGGVGVCLGEGMGLLDAETWRRRGCRVGLGLGLGFSSSSEDRTIGRDDDVGLRCAGDSLGP